MNRIDRLVAIVLFLQSKKLVKGYEIADQFGISLRTVYRDINALCEAGVPVAAEAGEGYSIVEGYHLPPVMFTHDEAAALFTGAKFVEHLTDESLKKHAQNALLKIRSVLPTETRDYMESLQNSTVLHVSPRPVNRFRDDILTMIQEAIVRRNVLRLQYYTQSRDTFTDRYVEPLALVYYSDHWHMIAWCRSRKDYRDFRTDRIKEIYCPDLTFGLRKDFSLEKYLRQYKETKDALEVKLFFPKRTANIVRDKNVYGLIKEEETADGWILTMVVPDEHWVIPWILSFGRMVKIISPESLKIKLVEEGEKIIRFHKEQLEEVTFADDLQG